MAVVPELHFAWLAGYVLTLPCMLAHIGIIIVLRRSTVLEPTNYLVVNLSFGAILQQITVALILVEDFVTVFESSILCGFRAIFVRIGTGMISFTLTLLVVQGSYFSRHPGLHPTTTSSQKKSSRTMIILVLFFTVILLLPMVLMRKANPDTGLKFKCKQVLLFDSIVFDSIYRCCFVLVSSVIPAVILLRELRKLLQSMKECSLRLSDAQTEAQVDLTEKLQFERMTQQRLRFLKNSFIFIFLFLCFSVPYTTLDATNSPAVKYPKNVKFYKKNIESLIYLIGYIIVIQIYPVYMFYLNRSRANFALRTKIDVPEEHARLQV